MSGKRYSTVEAAKAAKVPRATVQHWIVTQKLPARNVELRKGVAVRLWTEADVERMRELKRTLKPGPKPREKERQR